MANGDALDFGWRVREMELFTDDKCTEPASKLVYMTRGLVGVWYSSFTEKMKTLKCAK